MNATKTCTHCPAIVETRFLTNVGKCQSCHKLWCEGKLKMATVQPTTVQPTTVQPTTVKAPAPARYDWTCHGTCGKSYWQSTELKTSTPRCKTCREANVWKNAPPVVQVKPPVVNDRLINNVYVALNSDLSVVRLKSLAILCGVEHDGSEESLFCGLSDWYDANYNASLDAKVKPPVVQVKPPVVQVKPPVVQPVVKTDAPTVKIDAPSSNPRNGSKPAGVIQSAYTAAAKALTIVINHLNVADDASMVKLCQDMAKLCRDKAGTVKPDQIINPTEPTPTVVKPPVPVVKPTVTVVDASIAHNLNDNSGVIEHNYDPYTKAEYPNVAALSKHLDTLGYRQLQQAVREQVNVKAGQTIPRLNVTMDTLKGFIVENVFGSLKNKNSDPKNVIPKVAERMVPTADNHAKSSIPVGMTARKMLADHYSNLIASMSDAQVAAELAKIVNAGKSKAAA